MKEKQNRTNEIRTYDSEFWVYFVVFIAIVAIICCLPLLLTEKSWLPLNVSDPNDIGDTLGGTLGPFVALLASALTFLAFWVQYKANQQQRHDLKIERFENKFYELLRLHRANVEEMNISNRVDGRKCFIQLFNKLRYCYLIVEAQYIEVIAKEAELTQEQRLKILKLAYTIFFYGVGENSEKQYVKNLKGDDVTLFENSKIVMFRFQSRYRNAKKTNPESNYYTFDTSWSSESDKESLRFYYQPFDGHADLLGHYYRHLFQTVSYIDEQKATYFTDKVKYSYIKTLRAQLSNHEQLMLYYNSVSWFDSLWKDFFIKFRLIKNLPLGLADFGIKPEDRYKVEIDRLAQDDIAMFELHE